MFNDPFADESMEYPGQPHEPMASPGRPLPPPMEELALKPIHQDKIRQVIDFPASTYRVLEELAKDKSIGDALRDAIALSKWFKDTREAGARILVERNGRLREVITIKYPPER